VRCAGSRRALGSFSIASGWAILATGAESAWLGWWALSGGFGLVAARAVWTSAVWLIPYALFWVWILVVSSRMLRKRLEAARRST